MKAISNLKAFSVILLSGVLIGCSYWAYLWKSPGVNWDGERNLEKCIQKDSPKYLNIKSLGNSFEVDYIPNAGPECINPYFPVIRISTESNHNAWVQIVYTDTKDTNWQKFIDSEVHSGTFPFYSFSKNFYDGPHWDYTLFQKPLSFWKAHAYAVNVNHEEKIIQCVGGVQWGFELSYFKLRPHCLTPKALNFQDWEKDWSFLQNSLAGYKLENDSR